MTKSRFTARPGPFLRTVSLKTTAPTDEYPWNLPAVRDLDKLDFTAPVVMLAGDNGTGKSTLVEAIAVGAGFNAEGGTQNYLLEARGTVSPLARAVDLHWSGRPRHGWFLRAESFYNVASFVDDERLLAAADGGSLHERSHGESFIEVAMQKFGGNGFFVLDEPEAALSFHGCLRLLTIMRDAVEGGAQFIVATHSPLLLAYPGAKIYELDDAGVSKRAFGELESVQLWQSFLGSPDRFFRHLFT